ncbi:MAG: hypothetical protein GXP40_02555 [Chloroflexi bacterium]|nr:hypothetical protein [Chloroflexota bacterium]
MNKLKKILVSQIKKTGDLKFIQWVLPLLLFFIALGFEIWEHIVENIESREPPSDFDMLFSEVVVFGIIGPIAVWLVVGALQRIVASESLARTELEKLNRELEARVAERTADLAQRNLELARANAELQELDQMKSDFVALVSHELRAPLTALNGGLELALQDADKLPASTHRTLEVMTRESDRLTRFVQTILDLSRVEAGKLSLTMGPIAVLPLLQHTADIVLLPSKRSVRWDVQRELPPAWADETYLEEVLRNLLRNADKYSPPDQPVYISASAENGSIHISVTDCGPGIPSELQTRVFERFYRHPADENASPGWGLGLYFAHQLIAAQGGKISVHSPVWEAETLPGTTFTVTLQVAKCPDENEDC